MPKPQPRSKQSAPQPLAKEVGLKNWYACLRHVSGPGVVALVAFLAVCLTVSPATGPGVTCDEAYDFYVGAELVQTFFHQGASFFLTENIEQNFDLTVHPPLGRYLVGLTQQLIDPDARLAVVQLANGRVAAALVYAVMIFTTGLYTISICGRFGGLAAALGVALIPRVFGHAHLATLDTVAAVTYAGALYALVVANRQGKWWAFALAGGVWGLALLAKIHGVVLIVPAVIWMVIILRQRILMFLPIWFVCGATVFFAGWPWLWIDPLGHLQEFLGTATARATLNVFYWGEAYADVDAPWHYPFVMFLVTLPVGTLLLGVYGLIRSGKQLWLDPARLMCCLGGGFLLVLFAWPGTPVYDGVRLFLAVYPLWAVFVGIGASAVISLGVWSRVRTSTVQLLLVAFLLLQGTGIWLYQPFYLSHYSALVGGLAGAERLGFEITYWGDTVNGEVLDDLIRMGAERHNEMMTTPPLYGVGLVYAPQVAPFQAEAVFNFTPHLADTGGRQLRGWDPNQKWQFDSGTFAVVYRRRADEAVWEDLLQRGAPDFQATPVYEVKRQGVWLTRIYHWTAIPAE